MIISRKKKAIILRLRDPTRVTSIIPTSKKFTHKGSEYVAVKHGVEEVKVLRNIGINAPSPINYYYDWPGRFQPFDHQKVTAAFMTLENRAFNLNGMGTGKTLATLWAYDYLRSRGLVNKALVVTPLSTLERTWADEVFQHFPHLETSVLHGSREKRLALLESDADIYLVNHDGIKVSGFVDALKERTDIDLIIIDEIAQVGRNSGTDRFRALLTMCNRQVPRRVWGLTGTPTPNKPTDAWAQCRLLVPERVPPYFNRFKDQVMRQINQFLWVPRENAVEVVHEAMQPSIRFSLEECIDLPECVYQTRTAELTTEQKKAYKEMLTRLRIEAASGAITAANEAVKAQKLIQVACLAYNTPVLTNDGWVPIQRVTSKHRVWDGVEWVRQEGAAYMGDKEVAPCFGVLMTEDHKVLTTKGWTTAKEIGDEQTHSGLSRSSAERFNRKHVRLPDGYRPSRVDGTDRSVLETCDMAVPVRMWERGCAGKSVPSRQAPPWPKKLWVPPRERHTQNDRHCGVQNLVVHETEVLKPGRQRLGQLRRAWDNCVRTVAAIGRELLDGYGCVIQTCAYAGSEEQQRSVFPRELSVGLGHRAGQQQTAQRKDTDTERRNDGGRSRAGVQPKTDNHTKAHGAREYGPAAPHAERVYDLINCGPRNRFVVDGAEGPLIVHNCGVVYGSDGNEVILDAGPRMDVILEAIEQSGSKAIVFVPFVSSVHSVLAAVRGAGYTAEAIYGDVSKNERDRILGDFQTSDAPHVIVAQPATMSHGLNLTAASTIIWGAPISSNDIFQQANARISRPGQKLSQLIVMIEGTDIERKYYKRLKDKQAVQGLLLDMVQDSRVPA